MVFVGALFTTACGADNGAQEPSADNDNIAEETETDAETQQAISDLASQVDALATALAASEAEVDSLRTELEMHVSELTTTLTATQAEVSALRAEVDSLHCFVGHMTDEQRWYARISDDGTDSSEWVDGTADSTNNGDYPWNQGPNSDASEAYNECF